jgi:hypothetical protein
MMAGAYGHGNNRSRIGTGRNHAYLFGVSVLANIMIVAAASFGAVDIIMPTYSAIAILSICIIYDRTILSIYPALLLMTISFLFPLILYGKAIAVKIFAGHGAYDAPLLLSLYWFIALFCCYLPFTGALPARAVENVGIGRSDAVTILASVCLLGFSALMLKDGTLLTAGYRDITEERYGFIEFSALFTLVGYYAARSNLARQVLLMAIAVYLGTTFLVGLRLRFISVALVLFCCLFGMRIEIRWKLLGFGVAIILFILGLMRNSGFSLDAITLDNMFVRGTLVSTPGGAFQTSKFHAYYIDTIAAANGQGGLTFLIADILSIFISRGALPANMNIKSLTTEAFSIPGGGLLPGYFFAYLGVPGAIGLGALFTLVFVWIMLRTSPAAYPYKILLVAYVPRSLLYDWVVGFKMMFYFFVLSTILRLLARASQSQRRFPRE